MTKGGPFDAALNILYGAARGIPMCGKRPLEERKRQAEEIAAACRVLEAAGKCQVMLSSDGSGKRVIHLSDLMALEEALLAALPVPTRTAMNTRLKPCPFCGGEAAEVYFSDGRLHEIICNNMDCHMQVETLYWSTASEAIAAWNRRAPAPTEEK